MREDKFYKLQNAWEVLPIRDGSIVLNSIFGKQILIREPADYLQLLLTVLAKQHNLATIVKNVQEKHKDVSEQKIISAIDTLVEQGVLVETNAAVEAMIPDEIYQRFSTTIDVFEYLFQDGDLGRLAFDQLRDADVVILGVGGSGSLAAAMCAAVGVGSLTLIDGDDVEESNLVRQIFYREDDVKNGTSKVASLKRHLDHLSRYTNTTVITQYINGPEQLQKIIRGKSFLLLCADAPRFVINEWVNQACLKEKVPYINAFAGLVGPLTVAGVSPCFHCLVEEYREALGPLHDEIVVALQARRSRQYPSMVLGPVLTAYLQTKEMIGYLTQAWPVRTLDGYLQIDQDQITHKTINRATPCVHCHYGS